MEETRDIKIMQAMDVYLPDMDGVINCMHHYCLELNKETKVVAAVPKNQRDYVDNFPYPVVRCKSWRVPILTQYYGTPTQDKKFKEKLFNQEFDIVHIHSPFKMGRFALSLARKKNIPIVATFHTNFRPIFKRIFRFKWITESIVKNYFGKFYNKMDEIFVCSPEIEKQARSFGYKGKISLVPFGTEYEKPENLEALKKEANAKFSVPEYELVFSFVGRITELKRIDYILESLKIVKDRGAKFKFFICGRGIYMNTLKKLTKKLGFSDEEVVFLGFLSDEDLKLVYARSDLFLFPSLYDNFGLVKVEAATYSTPCLFIEGSAAGYGVTDGLNGFLSEDTNEAFAQKITEAISDRKRLKEIGENAARDLYFNWNDCTKVLMQKYSEIIAEKRAEVKTERTKEKRGRRNDKYLLLHR